MSHRVAPEAEADLDDIWCYIARKSGKRWTYAFSAHQVSFTYKTSPSFA